MLKPSEKPLLALIEAGGVNDLPVIMPVATPNDALIEALKTVREAGYGVVKPRQRQYRRKGKHKDRAGPTYVCRFNDGEVVRMTIFTSLTKLDWARGEKLALAAYESRWRMRARRTNRSSSTISLIAPVPVIVEAHFERGGEVLARRFNGVAP